MCPEQVNNYLGRQTNCNRVRYHGGSHQLNCHCKKNGFWRHTNDFPYYAIHTGWQLAWCPLQRCVGETILLNDHHWWSLQSVTICCTACIFTVCTSAHSQAALKQKYFARRIGQRMHFSNFRPHLINGSWKIYFFALDKPGWKVFDISLPGHILYRFSRRDPRLFDLVIFNSAKQMFGDMFHHSLLLITQFVQ